MPRDRNGKLSDKYDWAVAQESRKHDCERITQVPDRGREPEPPQRDDFKFPPFLLLHAEKIGLGFLVLGIALGIGAYAATGGVLPVVLGVLSAASFATSIGFFKIASDRDKAADSAALASLFDNSKNH